MNRSERRVANDRQFEVFSYSYDSRARLSLLLALEMALQDRSALGLRLGALLTDDEDLESFVYGAGTRAILSSALNETVMFCEDLFALVKFVREPEFFAKKLLRYRAGRVAQIVDELSTREAGDILKFWMVPPRDHLPEVVEQYDRGCKNLVQLVRDVSD